MAGRTPREGDPRETEGGTGPRAAPTLFASAEQIAVAVGRMADEIAAALAGRRVVAVPVMNGALFFAADLLRALARRAEAGASFSLEGFSAASISSYGDATEPLHAPRVVSFPPRPLLAGRTVLLVDTVVDRGATIAAARERALASGASEVRVACLVDKPARRSAAVEPDWRGLVAPDVFLVGYGLDAGGRFRTLPWLGAIPARSR